jgi:hypothetical protein
MKKVCFAIVFCLALSCGAARADVLDITFDQSVLAGSPGAVVEFFGTLDNTTDADLFLNADNFNLSAFDPSSIDDGPFFANTPTGFLDPDASTGDIGLFNITIPDSFDAGNYDGTFQVLGGATGDDQTIIGSADFTVQVTPEPASGVLLLTALIVLVLIKGIAVRRANPTT